MRYGTSRRRSDRGVVFAADGLYERIVIRDIPLRGRTARILLQDRNISGGLYLDDGSMAFDYTQYFDLYRLFTPELKTALAIGGGAYTVPRSILRDSPRAIVDVAEIDPSLHALALRYFALPDDARLRNHVIDGRRFLHDTAERYDLIFSDAYRSFISAPPQFATLEFFRLARSRLKEDGVLIANFYGSLAPEYPGDDLFRVQDDARRLSAGLCHRDGQSRKRGAAEFHLCRAQRLESGPTDRLAAGGSGRVRLPDAARALPRWNCVRRKPCSIPIPC